FFFSSRRRHTRSKRDWSSDVCSSDLNQLQTFFDQLVVDLALLLDLVWGLEPGGEAGLELAKADVVEAGGVDVISGDAACGFATQIGRASCRERGQSPGWSVVV